MRYGSMMRYLFIGILTGCAGSRPVGNESDPGLKFSELRTELKVVDRSGLGCRAPAITDIERVFRKGVMVKAADLHDHYSYTQCAVAGAVTKNDKRVEFTFDLGGILTFTDGTVMACGESCCTEKFEFCSWDPQDLAGGGEGS